MMPRCLRIVGLALAGLAALIALALAVLPSLARLDRYRDLIAARLSRAVGREVSLGAVRLRLWGRPGAEVRGLRIADRPGEAPVIEADQVRVRLEWRPLLRGEFRIGAAEIERPRISVRRRADGHWNLEDLGLPEAAARPGRPGRAGEGGPRGAGRLALGILSVTMREGEVAVEPGPGLPRLSLTHVTATASPEGGAGLLRIHAAGRIAEGLPGQFELTGQVRVESQAPDRPAFLGTLKITQAEVAPLLRGAGVLSVGEWRGPASLEGTVRGGRERFAFQARADFGPVAFTLPGRLRKEAGEPGTVAVEGRVEGPALSVDRFEITLRDLRIEGKASAGSSATEPVRFEARSARVDLRKLFARPAPVARAFGGAVAWAADESSGGRQAPAVASGPRQARTGAAGPVIEGLVRADEIVWDALRLSAATARVAYRQGRLRATAMRASVGGGSLEGEAEVDFAGREPAIRVRTALAGVRAEEVAGALFHAEWTVTGRMDLRSSVAWSGWPGEAGLGTARGEASLRMTDGRIVGYRPLERLSDLLGPFLPAAGRAGRLEGFDELAGRFTLDKGTLRTDDLTLRQGSGELRAAGGLDLATTALDVDVTARLKRATVEAKLTGTTANPVVTPKLTRIERRIEAEVDKALRGERGRKIRDLLKGLLKP